MRYSTILFDLDGTLLNTIDDLTDAVNYALSQNGLPEKSLPEVMASVGSGYANLIGKVVPGGKESPHYDAVVRVFLEYYPIHSEDKTRPYDGIDAMLRELGQRGCKMAVISNKGDAAVATLNRRFFGDWISVAIGEREGMARKPAPDAVFLALELLGASKEGALYVGDSDVDIETAHNAGLPCLAVSWGFRPKELLLQCGAENVVDTPQEALAFLLAGE